MKTYEVIGDLMQVSPGNKIRLDKHQARRRRHALSGGGEGGWFTAMMPLNFKKGEKITITESLDKRNLLLVKEIEK